MSSTNTTATGSSSGSGQQQGQPQRSLSEILQSAPTGTAHPGPDELRKLDPDEDRRRVVAFVEVR